MHSAPGSDGIQVSGDNANTNPLTEAEQRNLATMAAVEGHWNNHDITQILANYNEDIVWHNVSMQEVYRGKPEVQRFLVALFRALPDLTLNITFRIARGNFVAEEYVIRGTHKGPLSDVPATGRSLQIPCVSMVRMRDSKFLEDHFYYDAALVLRQMGLFPSVQWPRTRFGRLCLWLAAKTRRKRTNTSVIVGPSGEVASVQR
jgi:steroid delta-isomerase-like uncharacterized protein